MEVLEKGSPLSVLVQNGVREANDLIASMGKHGELARLRFCQSASPYQLAFSDDIPVEIGVEVGAPVVTPPTLGVEGRNRIRVSLRRVAVLHDQALIRHRDLLIDPGIGTVHSRLPDPSKSQIPGSHSKL